MKRLRLIIIVLCVFAFSGANAQLRVLNIEKLPLGSAQRWNQPQFSPDGKSVYYTSSDFNGVWEYSLASKTARVVTTDPHSGFGFAVSADGNTLAYRRTTENMTTRERFQEMVTVDLKSGNSAVVASGRDVSNPAFVDNVLSITADDRSVSVNQAMGSGTAVLGIERTKIAFSRDGKRILLDPLGNGSYIWPVLSPNKSKLAAYDMAKGTFVCDIDGKNIQYLGRRDAPSWTRDGQWIVYMDDRDDGHQILGSEIHAVSPDGKTNVQLTSTSDVTEMFPSCSPAQDKIVCSSSAGDLYVISYTEVPR